MYEKYHTDALVLASREIGEADRLLGLYTQDFGLVWARATSLRKESSKMRGAVQLYARARVSLVKGKTGWRLVGAHGTPALSVQGSFIFARIAGLMLRLVHGEEKHEYLYTTLAEAHAGLLTGVDEEAETLTVARILFALGYLPELSLDTPQEELIREINTALRHAHL